MIYGFCGALGFVAGLRLRWPGLLVVAVLAGIAIGIVGVGFGRQWSEILVELFFSMIALELGYAIPIVAAFWAARSPGIQRWLVSRRAGRKINPENISPKHRT